MSIVKRWQTPASLSLVLVAAILLVLALGLRAGPQPALASDTATPVQCVSPQPAAAPLLAPPVIPPVPANANIGSPRAGGSGADIMGVFGSHNQTQANDGGFGDIGMQFQNVNVNAPITNIHVSGTGNNVTVAADNSINVALTAIAPVTAPASGTPSTSTTPSTDPTTPSTSTTPSTDPTTPSTDPTPPSGSTPTTTPSTPSTTPAPTGSTAPSSAGSDSTTTP